MKFVLPMPPSINATYKTSNEGGFFKSEKAKEWTDTAGWQVKKQRVGRKTITGPVIVMISWFYKKNRDIDAGIKLLLDLLQKQEIYKDDMQIQEMAVHKKQDTETPRVEVEIHEIK